jgi:hypothetical protein
MGEKRGKMCPLEILGTIVVEGVPFGAENC